MFLYDMTWDEIAELPRKTTVLLPFGSVEQHSYHLPLGTDALIAEAIARVLEKQIQNELLVLPTTWLGCSRHHMEFAGSLTSEIETFIASGEQAVASMAHHGFKNFVLLNAHGGNVSKISILVEKLRYRLGSDLKIVGITYWDLISDEIRSIRETPLGGMGHACELETSILLAVRPELVRQDRIEADGLAGQSQFQEKDMFAPGVVTVVHPFQEISRHGGVGDPRTASATKGHRILEAVTSKLKLIIKEMEAGVL